jgi:hypothetical protein
MTNQWGYTDPAEQAHHERAEWMEAHEQPMPPPAQPPQSPLGYLDQGIPEMIVYGNGNGLLASRRNPVTTAAEGAVLGGLIGYLIRKRRERKAQHLQELGIKDD